MNITMVKGDDNYLIDCAEALRNSELGHVYFPEEAKAIQAIKEGLETGDLQVALKEGGTCVGFLWYLPKGAFHSYPYLHIIAVKEEFRNQGIGRKLLSYFETEARANKTPKLFLVVADFNPRAKQLYEREGYVEVGAIPSLYKKGVTEYLMMKEVET